jgi:hypothetical protein
MQGMCFLKDSEWHHPTIRAIDPTSRGDWLLYDQRTVSQRNIGQ